MNYVKLFFKKVVSLTDHLVDLVAFLLILSIMSLSGYMLWDSNQVYKEAGAKMYEAYIPTKNHSKSFEELQKINSDVIGWLKVNDTHINYPLVQCDNDDKYMNTNAEGKYSLSGSIFLHADNNPHFTDFNSIIYGHHMEKNMMFGDVGNFVKKRYFDNHPYGNLYYDGVNHGIEFIAVMQINAYNNMAFNVCTTELAKQEYIQLIEDNALYKRSIDISTNDHLVILTTCTSDMTNGRNFLVGKITDQTYPEKETEKNKGIGIDILNNNTYLELLILFIGIVISIALLTKSKKNKKLK